MKPTSCRIMIIDLIKGHWRSPKHNLYLSYLKRPEDQQNCQQCSYRQASRGDHSKLHRCVEFFDFVAVNSKLYLVRCKAKVLILISQILWEWYESFKNFESKLPIPRLVIGIRKRYFDGLYHRFEKFSEVVFLPQHSGRLKFSNLAWGGALRSQLTL